MARELFSVCRGCPGVALTIVWEILLRNPAAAQYRESPEYQLSEARFISAGFFICDFRPSTSNTLDDSLAIRYDQLMPVIGFHQGIVDVVAGYTRYRQEGMNREAVLLSATMSPELPLTGGREEALLLPVMLSSNFGKAETRGPQRETFNIASLGIGVGLKFRSCGPSHDGWVSLVGLVHYSFEGFGIGSGFSPALIGEAAVLLPDVVWSIPLALGYRFRLQSWEMSEEKFNYRSVSHGPYMGVVF